MIAIIKLMQMIAIFKEIFFASDRLKLPTPTFPMSSLLRLIVDHFEFSVATQTVVRFARRLNGERDTVLQNPAQRDLQS